MAVIGGERVLGADEVRGFVAEQLAAVPLDGRSLCVLVPDGTRSCPVPLLAHAVQDAVAGRVSRLTFLVALGTHAPMAAAGLSAHVGGLPAVNHEWWRPETFTRVGTLDADLIARLSGGRLNHPGVAVRVNRAVVEHDLTLIVGPVFPHEVAGFSGGTKYLFPGVGGQEIIDLSHWLGALITSAEIIGTPGPTPVRALIDAAADLVPAASLALCVVVEPGGVGLRSAAFGPPRAAWADAAAVSARTHIRYLDAPVRRVLSLVPSRYPDLWTGAKGFYKVEPVVADGGEVVLYAPHITEFSGTHPEIARIGYHCRDYFTGQWDRFSGVPWGDLAHSTHLRGAGTWDPVTGEHCRVAVTLATGIPVAEVRAANLGHLDPATVDVTDPGPDTLVVPDAGEILYRLRTAQVTPSQSATGSR